ncbi:MAG TPA: hypothetical protein VHM67_01115 [Gemmatimonadaceae bacterium]|nr:hypothetical protein [Gemmatimonadaceae bacterium]
MANDPSNLPAKRTIDRAALERVLRRAGELQTAAADPTDVAEAVTEEQLIALAQEVGLSPQHIRQALAEESTRPVLPEDHSLAGRWVGPGAVVAKRVVRGTREALLSTLDEWMRREECLQVKRRHVERVLWEPRRDFLGNIKRGFNVSGRGYNLTRAREVGATAVDLGDGTCMVQLDADLTSARQGRVTGAVASAATGTFVGAATITLGAIVGAIMLPVVAVAAVPVAIGAGSAAGIVRGYRGTAERAQLALEQALDAIEHGKAGTVRGPVADVLGLLGRVR